MRPPSRDARGPVARAAATLAGLVTILLVVGACLSTTDVLVGRPWKLVELAGAAPVDPDGVIGVHFGSDGRYTIDTGCNSGGGTYHVDGNRILLDSETLTAGTCPEPAATQQRALLAVVESGPSYGVDTGTGRLRLTSPAGAVLLFESP